MGVNKQEKVKKYISAIVEELKKYSPKKIILFGSRAKGYYKPNSDIDIAVDLELTFREKRKLKEKIDYLSGLYSVDLVFFSDIDNNFKNQILKEGIVLYEKE
jgi:predicted nucleotidyltransferase